MLANANISMLTNVSCHKNKYNKVVSKHKIEMIAEKNLIYSNCDNVVIVGNSNDVM